MKTVVFAKYSNDRADEFAICTEILKDENGKKSIRKRPVEKEGIHHVLGVYENYLRGSIRMFSVLQPVRWKHRRQRLSL